MRVCGAFYRQQTRRAREGIDERDVVKKCLKQNAKLKQKV